MFIRGLEFSCCGLRGTEIFLTRSRKGTSEEVTVLGPLLQVPVVRIPRKRKKNKKKQIFFF
jgi:hypothetical protein